MKSIRFGTDGWRGVIADDFTYDRVGIVCEAIGEYLREEGTADRGVAIGFDNRFASEEFALIAATVLTRAGIRVQLSNRSIPTPTLSFTIKNRNLGGGVMITASHNPAKYNGVKFKPWFAGSAPASATRAIEERANSLAATLDIDSLREQGPDNRLFSREDFVPDYLQEVLGFVDVGAIRERRPRLLFDPLYGSSSGVLDRALREAGCDVQVIHGEHNPGFARLHPEPIEEHLQDCILALRSTQVDGAVASDGDGDRLGAVTEDGRYVSPHHIFALLLVHLVEDRGLRGGVVKTVSTTTMINQLADRYQLPLYETPIGFKYIAELMQEQDILIGGEESGGIGIRGYIPERDATLSALLLVEMMTMRQMTLGGLVDQLKEMLGNHAYNRHDLRLNHPMTQGEISSVLDHLPKAIGQVPVEDVSTRDGIKLFLQDQSWLLLRASGTEPVLRIYAEAENRDTVERLLQAGADITEASAIRRAA